jgi:hypothetical protein
MARLFIALILAASLSTGCVSIPVQIKPTCKQNTCSRKHLVVGLFPGVGEVHKLGMNIDGEPATKNHRRAETVYLPIMFSAYNVLALGLPTVFSWVSEPVQPWETGRKDPIDPETGRRNWIGCIPSLVGFCKTRRTWEMPPPEEIPEEVPEEGPSSPPKNL